MTGGVRAIANLAQVLTWPPSKLLPFGGATTIVNGQKTWTSYAQNANMIFCLVRTSTDGKPQEGISFLLIDMASPGVEVRPSSWSTAVMK